MVYSRIIYFVSLVYSLNAFSQNKVIDSLKIDLRNEKNDSIRANTMYLLVYNYLYQSADSSLEYGKKLEQLANKTNSVNFKFKSKSSIGTAFLYLNNYDSAQVYYDSALILSESSPENKSAIYTNLGLLNKRKGNYQMAMESYLEGISFDEESGNNYGKFLKLMNIGNVYIILQEYHKAIEYNEMALALRDKIKNKKINQVLGSSLNNIGECYAYLEEYENSLVYYKKALKVNIENENKTETARNYLNIGSVYNLMDDSENALKYLKDAYSIARQVGVSARLQIDIHIALGKNYSKAGEYISSEYHFQKALDSAKEIENLPLISDSYLAISDHFSTIKRSVKAYTNYKLHIFYKDSIFKIDKLKNIQDIETKYETEKKDKELAEQKLQIQEQQNEILEKKNIYSLSLIGAGFLLLGSIGLWFYFRQRQGLKNKEIIAMQGQQEILKLEALIDGEEKERNRIAQDLHDGINGDLSVIKYKISSIESANFNQKDTLVYNDAISLLDNAVEQIRRISHNLAPPSLHNFDLIEAIQRFCTKLNASNAVRITFQYFGNQLSLEKEKETAIYRIIQELLTNIFKHSKATEALVQINKHKKKLHLTIEDNGEGFDVKTTGKGIGLQNIKSRVNFLNADMDINSSSEGTSINIEIDLIKNGKQ